MPSEVCYSVTFWRHHERKLARDSLKMFEFLSFSHLTGPFYSGVSFVAVLSSFYIGLQGPTSMTKQLEISMTFSGENGIILKLHNYREPGKYTRLLNTQWISCYKEEDERLAFAGHEPLEIVSIQNTNTSQDFESIIWPLHWFDFFFSGNWAGKIVNALSKKGTSKWWKNKDVEVILRLMRYAETSDAENTHIPQYILDIFDHWRFSKKRVVIAPWKFVQYGSELPPKLLNLFFHSLSDGTGPDDANPMVNLLTQRILNIFPGLEDVEISDNANYRFSLSLFIQMLSGLRSVKMGAFRQCEVKATWIPLGFRYQSVFSCPFKVSVTENKYGYKILRVQSVALDERMSNLDKIDDRIPENAVHLEIDDVD